MWKLTVAALPREAALTIAGALGDLLVPPPLAHTLFEAGTDWTVEAYFDHAIVERDLTRWLGETTGLERLAITVVEVPALNWVAISQAALPPVRAGRFLVHGEHDRDHVPRGPGSIEIAAGEAFGTAHHATTRGCLAAIDRLTRRRHYASVLDIGCGTAVLAIAAARAVPHARVHATDSDPIAVDVARGNVRLNGGASRIRVGRAVGWPRHVRLRSPALVVANILADPLIALAPMMARRMPPGADLVLSGILEHQAASVVSAYRASGFTLLERRHDTGWSILVLRRRR